MKKKHYQQPSTKTVEVKQRGPLLASPVQGAEVSRSSYGEAIQENWEDE